MAFLKHAKCRANLVLALWVVAVFPVQAAATSCPGIHIKILNIRNNTGNIGCALFESPEGFPHEYLRYANRIVVLKIQDAEATCDFFNIPPGRYALAVIHDENMNGKFEANWMGVPQEGYGFSNEPEAALTAPPFEAAEFSYSGQDLAMSIGLRY